MCQKSNFALQAVRKHFFALNIHAIVIPSTDPHQSEYVCRHWMMREWISGFTGSAGVVVITRDKAGLWTDSRYFIQAEKELEGSEIELFKQGEKDTPSVHEFLVRELEEGNVVSLNHKMWSQNDIEQKERQLKSAGIEVNVAYQPVEAVWESMNRPALPQGSIFEHPGTFIGSSIERKLADVRDEMKKVGIGQLLITTLDDIAWLFNLRGYDVDYNPVFLSYAIISEKTSFLFIDEKKIDSSIRDFLSTNGVIIKKYNEINVHLSHLERSILVNKEDCNGYLYKSIKPELIINGRTITRHLKACKNIQEISHTENAMIKDGVALAKAFYHLYQNLDSITEDQFATFIALKRSEESDYYGESFPAIIGYQSNGAIVHYRPKEGESAIIKAKGLLLCDSGGQYFDGTTDITRTIAVGPLSEQQMVDYTCVLKGHIAIDQATFPEGTTGSQLDPLARQFLWKNGKNFGHGTGHGVGYFLNVHEAPQGISPGIGLRSTTAFRPGMITSNEPGYYEQGSYGIRIENLLVCERSNHEGYLSHRHLTLFPIDTAPIVWKMLTQEEVIWLNEYHNLVLTKVLPFLPSHLKSWFSDLCKQI